MEVSGWGKTAGDGAICQEKQHIERSSLGRNVMSSVLNFLSWGRMWDI